MPAFGMIVLLGLAVLVLTGIVGRYLAIAREFSAIAMVVLGIAAAWIADFDLFGAWGLTVRNHAIGLLFTGIVVAGVAYFWQPILRFFDSLARKHVDEAETLEKTQNLRRVA